MELSAEELAKLESVDTIQPTNTPENLPTNDDGGEDIKDYVTRLEQRLAAQQIEFRKIEKKLHEVDTREPQAPPPPRNIEEEDRQYYTSPTRTMDAREQKLEDRIMARIEKSLEPIRQVATRFATNDAYQDLKNEVAADPAFRRAMQDKDVMSIVDRMMSQPGTPMEAATLKMAISSVSWSKQNGMIPGLRNDPPRNDGNGGGNGDRGDITPPYIQPSNRRRDPPAQKRELTEDDRLAMRIGGITDPEEYWKLMDEDVMRLPSDKPIDRKKK